MDATYFFSKTPQFSAQKFKVASRNPCPTLAVPFKMNRTWPSELAFEAALSSVPERWFPSPKAMENFCSSSGSRTKGQHLLQQNNSGRRWDKRGHWGGAPWEHCPHPSPSVRTFAGAPGGAGKGFITAWPGVWAELLQVKDRWKAKGLSLNTFPNEEACFENCKFNHLGRGKQSKKTEAYYFKVYYI